MTKRVKFKGREFVWLDIQGRSGALAPLSHVDKKGNIKVNPFNSDSFAHVFPNGEIKRYGEVIGHRDDLKS